MEKKEIYIIKKGKNKVKRMSLRLIFLGYKDILNNMLDELKLIVINFFNEIYFNGKEFLLKNKKNIVKKLSIFNELIKKDLNSLFEDVYKVFDIY